MTLLKCAIFSLLVLSSIASTGQTTQRIYLSGTDNDHTVPWDFMVTKGRNAGTWSSIPVPSCWEMQGFGTYHYGWEEDHKSNETGYYRRKFVMPSGWKNKTVRLVFEGSMTDTEVKINGRAAGPVHRGSFYRFKYDVTKLLRDQNLLEVKVDKISADTSVNRAERMSDFWVFGGIYRPVYLEVLPHNFVDWFAIDAKADGSFKAEVYCTDADGMTLEGEIFTDKGERVGGTFSAPVTKLGKTTVTTKVTQPHVWTPELPNLYRVVIRLKRGERTVHEVSDRFGFRTVEFRERDGFYVNGVKIMMKGVNRHSFWPTTGRTTSKKMSVVDVNLIKDMNMNAVRMSHYPPDDHFLDVCDSLGLFVLDELCGWQKKYDTPVGKMLVKEMVMKDVNHPSIIIWDNGNEGGNNHELVKEYHLYDPQRRKVIHPWNIFQGTDTQHYKGYGCCIGSLYNGKDVFFPTEILHGLYDGGHGAGLNDHWQLMVKNPLSAGCFLWSFADEGIVRADRNDSLDTRGNLAPDGIVGPFREKEGSFYTIKEIWSPVQISEKVVSADFDGLLAVENKYLYTNLSKVRFQFQYRKFTLSPSVPEKGEVVAEGTFAGPDVAPGGRGLIRLPIESLNSADILYVSAFDPYNRELFTWSWFLKSGSTMTSGLVPATSSAAVVTETERSIELKSGDVTVAISKVTGLIERITNRGSVLSLKNGPRLTEGNSEVESVRHFRSGSDHVVEVKIRGVMKKLQYTILNNGVLKVDYAYSLHGLNDRNEFDFPGVTFTYSEEKVKGVRYFGRGPYRVWKNRLKGGMLGMWDKKYNNTITGESWDYPEFKGYYKDFVWVFVDNEEIPFVVFTPDENIFLRLFTPLKPKGARNEFTSPAFPPGDISFLHGINAIGTKFDAADNHGPEGQKNKTGWEWVAGTLYFDFDPLHH
jgi:hypothetical protein